MKAFLTSCNRPKELLRTLKSLEPIKDQLDVIRVHEDCDMKGISQIKDQVDLNLQVVRMNKGQIGSICHYFENAKGKYYLHLEDDWLFNHNVTRFIDDSIEIMEKDPNIIKVLSKAEFKMNTEIINGIEYICETELYRKVWHGFSWNPGVTRLDLLKERNLNQHEHDIDMDICILGYRVAYLPYDLYTHIGFKSTRL